MNISKKIFLSLAVLFVVSGFFTAVTALAITSGPADAGTGADVSGIGTITWTNPSRIVSNNNSYATATVNGTTTHYLKGTNYGFSIPSDATINGIQVTIGRFENTTGSGNDVRDNVVSLMKAGVISGDNKAITGTDWPTSETAITYGTSSDLWGTTWSPSDINNANFGVALSVNSANNRTASVDYMQITITYTAATYTITSSAGSGGTISPNGATILTSGNNQTYTITPSAGNIVSDVLVDSVSQGKINSYTFSNVTANHTISATFDSGWSAPTDEDNNNSVTNGEYVFISNNQYAEFHSQNDSDDYDDFNLSIPNGATITGIEVAIEGNKESNATVDVSLTWNANGAGTFTAVKNSGAFTSTDSTRILGGTNDTWGRTWTASEFSNSNFNVRVESVNNDNLDIDQLQVKVTYTLGGTIVITKVANGGNATFPFTTTGGLETPFDIDTTQGPTKTFNNVTPGSYTVTEGVLAGWDFTELLCVDPTTNTTVNLATATIDVSAGETVTCTYTNTKKASITVEKNVVNPDGGEVEDGTEFTVTLNGSDSTSISEGIGHTYSNLTPGVEYTITETQNANYGNIVYSGDCDADGKITPTAGQDAVCVITNWQKKATLIINKTVDNSHGLGTADANDFSYEINDGDSIPFTAEEGANIAQAVVEVNPGTYTITESNSLGYAVGYQDCTGLTLDSNEEAVCNITNYDLDPAKGAITVIKNVVNDNNGNKDAEDFTLKITPSEEESMVVESGEVSQLLPGTYTVSEEMSESLQEKYTYVSTVCTDNGVEMNTEPGVISLEAGHVYECIITNDDKPAQLTIVKNTGNENYNGTFEFTVSGEENVSVETSSGTGQQAIEIDRGSYNVVEIVPAGWNFSGVSCQYDGEEAGIEIENGENIYVSNGGHVTCTFTNTRQTGSITVIKVVETTDENITADDFSIHVQQDGEDATEPAPGQGGEGYTYEGLPTGTYTLTETGVEGYTASYSESCSEGTITVVNGETITCTITNTQITDADGDGQSDADELACGSDPNSSESTALDTDNDHIPNCVDTDDDGDEVVDTTDNCPVIANTDQADNDQDATGNVCDSTPNGTTPGGGSVTPVYTITTSVNGNGSISPAGAVSVSWGTDKTFTFTPDSGFHVGSVLVDGTSAGSPTTYTFNAVKDDHTIAVTFTEGPAVLGAETSANSSGTGSGLLGDLNHDGKVDGLDAIIMVGEWGKTTSEADLNNDGIVNEIDFAILMANWS